MARNTAAQGEILASCIRRMRVSSTPAPPLPPCSGTLVKPGQAGSSEECTIVVASECETHA